jgi:hypothetical protein
VVVMGVVGVACAWSGLRAPPPPHPFDDATIVRATQDPVEIERMLMGSVVNGGLWFADPACAAKFGTPGEIKPDRFATFARCLAGLHLQASPRKDALPGVLVLTYAPGFEIEARFQSEWFKPRLTWIGYEAQTSAEPLVATITVTALEAGRLAGDRTGPIDEQVANTLGSSWSWLKVCAYPEGAVTVQPREGSSGPALHAFAEAASGWKFRPFVPRDRAIPVCAMVRLTSPPERPDAEETLPIPGGSSPTEQGRIAVAPAVLERVEGPKLIIPDDQTKTEIQRSGRERVTSIVKMCLDEAGHVDSARPLQLTGFPAYDKKIIAGIRTWVFRPYLTAGKPTAVCTVVSFTYSQH